MNFWIIWLEFRQKSKLKSKKPQKTTKNQRKNNKNLQKTIDKPNRKWYDSIAKNEIL